MADKVLTLLDATKLSGNDLAVGLVEEVTTYAPELDRVIGRTIAGTTYKTMVRTALPAGPVFRNANEGVDLVASSYEQRVAQCYYIDGQLAVDEMVANAPDGFGRDMLLAQELSGLWQQKAIALGDQFYSGTTADAKGFAGLQASYDSTNMEVSAGGNPGASTSAWIVWVGLKGLHFVFGGNAGLNVGAWQRQQVKDANSKSYMAWVNNLSGWIGLVVNHSKAIGRIKLITSAKPLTDALLAELLAKFPLSIRNAGSLVCFINRTASMYLQKSRTVALFGQGVTRPSGAMELVAPPPTEAFGVPIVVTDSIRNDE